MTSLELRPSVSQDLLQVCANDGCILGVTSTSDLDAARSWFAVVLSDSGETVKLPRRLVAARSDGFVLLSRGRRDALHVAMRR